MIHLRIRPYANWLGQDKYLIQTLRGWDWEDYAVRTTKAQAIVAAHAFRLCTLLEEDGL